MSNHSQTIGPATSSFAVFNEKEGIWFLSANSSNAVGYWDTVWKNLNVNRIEIGIEIELKKIGPIEFSNLVLDLVFAKLDSGIPAEQPSFLESFWQFPHLLNELI